MIFTCGQVVFIRISSCRMACPYLQGSQGCISQSQRAGGGGEESASGFSFFFKARGLQRNNTMAQLPPAAVYENCRLSPLRAAKYMPSLWRPLSRESFSSNPVETITAALRNTSSACCRRSRFAPSSSRGGLQAQELLASRGYCVPECSV